MKEFVNKYTRACLLILATVGVALDLIVIRHGVGASGDAVWYMQGAENILKGYGYGLLRGDSFLPTTMFPPFYSIFLAAFGWFGVPVFNMAGVLNAILLGGNIFLTGWIVQRLSGSAVASILTSAFTLLCFDLFAIHTWAMSEPLYLALTLLSLLSSLHYQKNGKRIFLVLAGLAAGLGVITRYVGISLVAVLCLWMLVFGKGSLKKRLLDVVILGILGVLPVALFFIRNAALAGTLAGRSAIVFHAIPSENYVALMQTLITWFFPGIAFLQLGIIKKIVFLGLVLLSAVLFVVSTRHASQTKDDDQRLYTQSEYLVLIFLALYGLTFMGSIYLSLAGNPTIYTATQISRYLTPVFPISLILAVLIFLRFHKVLSTWRKLFSGIATGLALAILLLYGINFVTQYTKGIDLGYTGIRNLFPAAVTELESIDPARPLIASNYELVTFLAGRPVYSMPGEGDELTGIANPNLPQLLESVTTLLEQGAILVVFRSAPDESFYYGPLISTLTLLHSYGNGWISISLYAKAGVSQ